MWIDQERQMDLNEAIAHADQRAGACETECQREHAQLAEWLRELAAFRAAASRPLGYITKRGGIYKGSHCRPGDTKLFALTHNGQS
jgi:hypothetical protein